MKERIGAEDQEGELRLPGEFLLLDCKTSQVCHCLGVDDLIRQLLKNDAGDSEGDSSMGTRRPI